MRRNNKSTTATRTFGDAAAGAEEKGRCLWFIHTPVPFVLNEKIEGEERKERKKEKKCRLVEDIDPFL